MRTRGADARRGVRAPLRAVRAHGLAWLTACAGRGPAEDLAQDVWTVFHRRWRRDETDPRGGRPVLSFLYRTTHFVLRGRRRRRELLGAALEALS